MITREIPLARVHRATRHTDKTWAEKMQANTIDKFEAQSSKKSVPEPAGGNVLGRNAASALAMKSLINIAGRHMIQMRQKQNVADSGDCLIP
jgi:hypothetical protein